MTNYIIRIYGVGVEDDILERLALALSDFFNAEVAVDKRGLSMGVTLKFYNPERDQVDASALLDHLHSTLHAAPGERFLVVVKGDGYVEGLNFVFGVAREGWGGIVFTAHLDPEFYGREPNTALLRARLLKEALHELGHSYGLPHCSRDCVMRFSNSVYDVDRKPAKYCAKCRATLNFLQPGLLR